MAERQDEQPISDPGALSASPNEEDASSVAPNEEDVSPNLVMFEGETYEVVEIDETVPPPDDDESTVDFEDNVEELLEGIDELAVDDGESVDGGPEEDDSVATMAGHADSVYAVAAHRDKMSGKVRVNCGLINP